jgi:hypothetical protein
MPVLRVIARGRDERESRRFHLLAVRNLRATLECGPARALGPASRRPITAALEKRSTVDAPRLFLSRVFICARRCLTSYIAFPHEAVMLLK